MMGIYHLHCSQTHPKICSYVAACVFVVRVCVKCGKWRRLLSLIHSHFVTWLAMGPQNYCENLKCKLENDKREEEKRKRNDTIRNKATKRAETRREETREEEKDENRKRQLLQSDYEKSTSFTRHECGSFIPRQLCDAMCECILYLVSYSFISPLSVCVCAQCNPFEFGLS